MYKFLTLSLCLVLTACASNPKTSYQDDVKSGKTPLAKSPLEAIHNTQAIPLPINQESLAPNWPITANEPRLDFGSSISNYRVFSLNLKKGERYQLNIHSNCNDGCLGVSKYAIKPRVLVLDAYGTIIADKPSNVSILPEKINMNWQGEASEDGTYYVLVAADNDAPGQTIVLNDVWVTNSPLMGVKTSMYSSPFGTISASGKR
ncbi:hypothetical protein WG219_06755 [Ectopseudomonas mendocina]|uniref:Lipoprotein n=1 Tax=Ectopseudomonas mendocina TaxID=300 RepID=A0ABZ2RL48_ECTME